MIINMKTRIYSKIVIALAFIIAVTSCKDLFNDDDIKKNPNDPSEDQVTIKPLTSGTLVGLGTLYEDTDVRIAFMWGGQLAGQSRQHAGFQNYTVAASTFGWANYYNVLKNAKLINKKATAINNKRATGMSQVVEAMIVLKLTSLWGDVPYTEALDEVKFPTPKYDGQLSIYANLVTLLNTAYANLTSGVGSISGDFIYGGTSSKWAAAAKTLQARVYLHLKDYPNAIAAASLGIGSASDDMLMIHGSSQTVDNNLNFDFFDNSRPGDTSFDPPAYLPVFMCTNITTGVTTTDKAKRNAKTDETGIYFHFFQYGAESAGGLDPNTADGMFVGNAPHPLLTYYENQLIIAEANARLTSPDYVKSVAALNNVRAGLATGYINGLTSGYGPLLYTPYDEAVDFISGGVANPSTGPNAGKTKQQAILYEIASQKFVVLLAQYEVFNELRRLQVATPVVSLGIPINNGTKYPGRFIYPQNEINTNPNTPNPAPDQFVKLPVFQ
jgi:starch-binding outer membrane protein, SusD/RagB family